MPKPGKLIDPRLTKAGKGYIEPFIDEMDAMAKHYGFRAYPVILIKDMANLASGGKMCRDFSSSGHNGGIQDSSNYLQDQLNEQVRAVGSDTLIRDEMDIAESAYGSNLQALASLPWHTIPGTTPLAKAFVVLTLLMKSGFDPNSSICPGGIRSLGDRVKQHNEMLSTEQKMMRAMRDKEDSVETGQGNEKSADKEFIEAIDFLNQKKAWVWERVSRQLELAKTFNARRTIHFKPESSGDETRYRSMNDVNEIQELAAFEWVPSPFEDPLFLLKLAEGDCDVRERGLRLQKKQLIYLVIDSSGSMTHASGDYEDPMRCPARKASGVIFNRIKAVVDGDAALFVRFFSMGWDGPLYKILDEKDALSYLRKFSDGEGNLGHYSGGGTDIPRALRDGLIEIKQLMEKHKKMEFVRPELILVTDGECDCTTVSRLDFLREHARLHYMEMLAGSQPRRRFTNLTLARIAAATGGIYARF